MSLIDGLSPTERRAVALVGLMIRMHGGRDGEGLFTGVARYSVLEQRARLAAERSRSVRQCWDLVARTMRWSISYARWDEAALALIAPADDDADVLRALAERTQSVVMVARYLARSERTAQRPGTEAPASYTIPELNDPLDIFRMTDAAQPSAPAPASSPLFGDM